MILRQATAKDLDRIHQITFDAFGPYCAAEAIKKRYGIGGGIADKARSVRSFCEQHLNRVLVADEGGQVVGYYSSIPHEEYGIEQLGANAVDPAYQGRGIGTRMARHVVRELIEKESQEILFVATLVHDKPARKVYENVGFTEVYRQVSFSNWQHLLDPGRLAERATTDAAAPEIKIRPARPPDMEHILEIVAQDSHASVCPQRLMEERFGTLAGKTWRQQRMEQVQHQWTSAEIFVAEGSKGPAGYASLASAAGSEFCHVTYPCVDQEEGRAGLRDQLLAYVLRRAQTQESIRIIDLEVSSDDEEAVGSCKRVGFEEFSCGIGFAMRSTNAIYS